MSGFDSGLPIASTRQQAAVDFMVSYGMALLILAVALYAVFAFGILNNTLTPQTCTASPGFSCQSVAYYDNGLMVAFITDDLGGTMNVVALACSSSVNTIGNGPMYGDGGVLDYAKASRYYPDATIANGIVVYSGNTVRLDDYCYGKTGLAKQNIGTTFSGYLWVNYTYAGLPSGFYTISRAIQFTEKVG